MRTGDGFTVSSAKGSTSCAATYWSRLQSLDLFCRHQENIFLWTRWERMMGLATLFAVCERDKSTTPGTAGPLLEACSLGPSQGKFRCVKQSWRQCVLWQCGTCARCVAACLPGAALGSAQAAQPPQRLLLAPKTRGTQEGDDPPPLPLWGQCGRHAESSLSTLTRSGFAQNAEAAKTFS